MAPRRTATEKAAAKDELTAYRITQKQAHAALKKAKIDPEDRDALREASAGAAEGGGTVEARLARHALKWLPAKDSETTIPLTAAEAKALGLK
jgi:hypothetical protein